MNLESDHTTSLQYTPDQDIKVHEEGAIRLICSTFQSHEAGLPEWLKNSADEYARQNVTEDQRIIVVFIDHGSQTRRPSISVLDFGGMSSSSIENNFRQWADPDASRFANSPAQVQGGHGNGGKCYMTMMFTDHALIHTVKDGVGCRYGVEGGTFRFGYIPDHHSGKDFQVPDLVAEIEEGLRRIGCRVESLPPLAQEALRSARGFTLVTGVGPKGYNKNTARTMVDSLRDHAQMIRTLEFCKVFVVNRGKLVKNADPITLDPITPDPDFIDGRAMDIPEKVMDPLTRQSISTTGDGLHPRGVLRLRTSDRSMRYTRKHRHFIFYHGESGYIGYKAMGAFDVTSSSVNRIYGECRLASLEPFKQNAREQLTSAPLTRGVDYFISKQISVLAGQFEALARRSYDKRERSELSKLNEVLDEWKNQFLSKHVGNVGGEKGGDSPDPPPRPSLPQGIPDRIEVRLTHRRAGIGVAFRPVIRFFDGAGTRIRPVPYEWVSNDPNVAWVDGDLNVVNTFAKGRTAISAQTLDGTVESNKVTLNVMKLRKIELKPEALEMRSGSRSRIEAVCTLSDGTVASDVALIWTEDDPLIARVSANGLVYGGTGGVTTVTAGDDSCMADKGTRVNVVGGFNGDAKRRGRSYPRILVSSVDADPDTGNEVILSVDDPPVYQRIQDIDRNIWWINSSSPLAQMYLDQGGGYGYDSREWRIYHVERYIEAIAQIALVADPDLDLVASDVWVLRWGERVAEVQAAAVESLSDFIRQGELPITQ